MSVGLISPALFFVNSDMADFSLNDLAGLIAARTKGAPAISYTRSLLDGGAPRAAKKFGEESVELIIAALGPDKRAVTGEAADVLFHFLVLLQSIDLPLENVMAELGSRTRQSGLQEKAARKE